MRTTLTLDEDVAALIRRECARTGETFRDAVNRLLRSGARRPLAGDPPPLPLLPGRPVLDVSDVSALLAAFDDKRRAPRSFP